LTPTTVRPPDTNGTKYSTKLMIEVYRLQLGER
jgi:hypothetical protein